MHVSEYVCKICHKGYVIYYKCDRTIEYFIIYTASNFNKNAALPTNILYSISQWQFLEMQQNRYAVSL